MPIKLRRILKLPTPEELEAVTNMNMGALTTVAIYLTVVSGYLAAAYLAGSNLRRSQLLIISCLFVTFALVITYSTYSFVAGAAFTAERFGIPSYRIPGLVMVTAECIGIISALKFMIDIRKSDD